LPPPEFNELASSLKGDRPLIEENTWMWGQVNRIFPIKLGLRVLYMMLNDDQAVELETFREKSADIAFEFAKMLRANERTKNISRDEKVSTGLPLDNDSERTNLVLRAQKNQRLEEISSYMKHEEYKSKLRYKSHFLASVRKDGRLDGAMPFLKFVNIKKHNKEDFYIGLTEAGLEFAKLENLIIEKKDFSKSLSESEANFYLNHIEKNVRGEYNAIKWLLNKLKSGITEREIINQVLKSEFGEIWNVSDAVINTQRAGLMARMSELGLIDKEKEGIHVKYSISEKSKYFLEKYK
jgi:hypothetical protein